MASNKKKKYTKKKSSTSNISQEEIKKPLEEVPLNDTDTLGKNKLWIAVVLIAIASLISYGSAFNNELTNWDDNHYVKDNPVLQKLDGKNIVEMFASKNPEIRYYMGNYHPMAMLSLAIDFQIGGKDKKGNIKPWPYITTNVVFHILNSILVFFLIFLLWKRVDIGLIAALLFSIHPIHVESVAWISERKDVLYTFFFLLSLISYLKYIEKPKAHWLIMSLLTFILSLLSKGQAVSLAPTLVLIDWLRRRNLLSLKLILEKVPYFVLGFLFGLAALKAQDHGQAIHRMEEYPLYVRGLFASLGFSQYLFKLAIPHNLAAIYPYPILKGNQPNSLMWLHLLSTLGFLSLGVFAFIKKYRNLTFGFAFFIVNILLLLQLIPVGSAVMADRYSYIPSIGIHAIVAFGFMALYSKLKLPLNVTYAAVMIYAVSLGVYTFKQADKWQDSMAVWTQTLEVSPKSVVAWNNRGSLKEKKAKKKDIVTNPRLMESAIRDFDEAIKIKHDYTTALYNRGVAYHDLKRYQEALKDFNTALKFDPTMGEAYHNRGLVKDKQGQYREAIADFEKALKFTPDEQKIYVNRGVAHGKLGEFKKSIENFNTAIEMDPKSSSAYSNRGLANDFLNNISQAIQDYSKAIELDSEFVTAYGNRGIAYQKLQNWKASVSDLSKAIQLNPNMPHHYVNRAKAFHGIGRSDLACKDIQTAQKLGVQNLEKHIVKYCGK